MAARVKEEISHQNVRTNGDIDTDSVIILTPTTLTTDQVEVLKKGSNFFPDSNVNPFQTILYIKCFSRLF